MLMPGHKSFYFHQPKYKVENQPQSYDTANSFLMRKTKSPPALVTVKQGQELGEYWRQNQGDTSSTIPDFLVTLRSFGFKQGFQTIMCSCFCFHGRRNDMRNQRNESCGRSSLSNSKPGLALCCWLLFACVSAFFPQQSLVWAFLGPLTRSQLLFNSFWKQSQVDTFHDFALSKDKIQCWSSTGGP